jgi:hypothetical protein
VILGLNIREESVASISLDEDIFFLYIPLEFFVAS